MIINSSDIEKAQLIISNIKKEDLIDTKDYIENLKKFAEHPISDGCLPFMESTVIPHFMPIGYYIKSDEKHFQILAGQFEHMYLYRGENRDYPEFTPSIDRLDKEDIDHCIEWIKAEEFKEFFKSCIYYKRLSEIEVAGYNFQPDIEAIAQHYGFATSYLDFTQHHDVARFFALTYFDKEEGIYKPIREDDDYVPRIYSIKLTDIYDLCKDALKIVGLQPLGRPTLQMAFAIDTRLYNNDLKSNFKVTMLKKDNTGTNYIYNDLFNKGKTLFPDERILQDVNRIKNGNGRNANIPSKWLLKYSKLFNKDYNKLRSQLSKKHYKVVDKFYALTKAEQEQINIETTTKILPWIEKNIGFMPKELNLPPY